MIAANAVIYPGVAVAEGASVGLFCIIGEPFAGQGAETTVIGEGAVIRSHTVIYAGNTIGRNFRTGNHANIRELNRIGDDVSIGSLSVIEHHVVIEDGVRIHSQAFIPEFTVLKRDCWIGPHVVITNARYPRSPGVKEHLQGVTVGENSKIGANVTILPGVTIGRNTLVGAGSVVTRDLPENGIYAGNPAVLLRQAFY